MRIVWSTLWFSDYRIPVFEALSKIEGVDFYLVYSADANSEKINEKVKNALGDRVIPMTGEKYFGKSEFDGFANKGFRIPYQPGLIKTVKSLKPDVLVSDGFFQWSYSTLFLRATKGIPHVMCYERTMHTERNAQKIRTLYRKLALRWIDVVCCSGSLCQEYVRYLGFDGPLTEGFMVADVKAFNKNLLAEGYKENENEEVDELEVIDYLFVGRLIELKGIVQLIDAWKKFVQDSNVNARLTIIGGGELEDYVKKETLNENSILFKGEVKYDEVPKYYLKADIFILPTLEDNWSLVVSEAMASSLPIITSIYNGCYPELVTKENGWVMDPLNAKDFLDTLQQSYNARHSFANMGKKSLQLLDGYTPESAALSVYKSCELALNRN
ncbi:glycosyltransferase family 4 protein [Winogradskyella sp.]|uniref:glycosyltransferase family 4 protein n=1 Tax=Winogradskyella sp. TaxID=1883156 RepID=UPI002612A801|nr:glycosyltransferase family 4 protein [Winogradskyella sp.]